jgi:hypothetical protein
MAARQVKPPQSSTAEPMMAASAQRLDELREHPEQAIEALRPRPPRSVLSAAPRALAHADIAEQHRQQDQVGKDQHGDAEAGGEREVLDDGDVDHHQDAEADRVGE